MNRLTKFSFFIMGCLLIGGLARAANQRAVSFGTTLPSTCFAGDLFFKTNAAAGLNVYACVAANTWVVQGVATLAGDVTGPPGAATVTQIQGRPVVSIAPSPGQALVWNGTTNRWEPQTVATSGGGGGGGATMASQLGDLTVAFTSGTVLTIGPNCSVATPCNIRFGALGYVLTSPMTATISGGTGNAYIYVASSGTLTVGNSMTVNCSGPCTAVSGITAFPSDSIPLFLWHATNGSWDSSGTDERAFLSSKDVIPGTGMITMEQSGHTTISADPTVISLRAAVPPTSSTACTAGAWATDSTYYYLCVTQNSWRRAALSTW